MAASDIFCIHGASPLYTNSGRERREAHEKWPVVVPENAAPVTPTILRTDGAVSADSRQ